MSSLNQNVSAHRLIAKHGDKHSLIHDDPLGPRYLVRMDLWGSDHVAQSDRIVTAVNNHDKLVSTMRAIVDCYGVGWKDPTKFCAAVDEFIMDGKALLAKLDGQP